EDTASLLMECVVDDVTVPVHVHQDYVMQPPSRTCEVIGEDGRIAVDFRAATVRVTDAAGRQTETSSFEGFDRNDMFVAEMSHFRSSVRGETLPAVTVGDAAVSLRVALSARRSLETREVVALA